MMAWVVDTCIVIDVLENDPVFGSKSAEFLESKTSDGLVLCPVSMVELSPAFGGNLRTQKHFLDICGIDYTQNFLSIDTEAAHEAWHRHISAKRRNQAAKRPVADILIGAFASRFQGLITRNPDDFRPWFPSLAILNPVTAKT